MDVIAKVIEHVPFTAENRHSLRGMTLHDLQAFLEVVRSGRTPVGDSLELVQLSLRAAEDVLADVELEEG